MTDKELLELAAKAYRAAGANIIDSEAGPQIFERFASDGTECYGIWRPLEDDGDALRLAVRLGLLFKYMHDRLEMFQTFYYQELDKDLKPSEATRRAIVRAAAEIGKAMP